MKKTVSCIMALGMFFTGANISFAEESLNIEKVYASQSGVQLDFNKDIGFTLDGTTITAFDDINVTLTDNDGNSVAYVPRKMDTAEKDEIFLYTATWGGAPHIGDLKLDTPYKVTVSDKSGNVLEEKEFKIKTVYKTDFAKGGEATDYVETWDYNNCFKVKDGRLFMRHNQQATLFLDEVLNLEDYSVSFDMQFYGTESNKFTMLGNKSKKDPVFCGTGINATALDFGYTAMPLFGNNEPNTMTRAKAVFAENGDATKFEYSPNLNLSSDVGVGMSVTRDDNGEITAVNGTPYVDACVFDKVGTRGRLEYTTFYGRYLLDDHDNIDFYTANTANAADTVNKTGYFALGTCAAGSVDYGTISFGDFTVTTTEVTEQRELEVAVINNGTQTTLTLDDFDPVTHDYRVLLSEEAALPTVSAIETVNGKQNQLEVAQASELPDCAAFKSGTVTYRVRFAKAGDWTGISQELPTVTKDENGKYTPEFDYFHDYSQTLTMKWFLGKPDENGDPIALLDFEQVLDTVKQMDNLTEGIPKIIYLVGWQYNGHDDRYPNWDKVNEALKGDNCGHETGLECLQNLMDEAWKYNTCISFHINSTDIYENAPDWDKYVKNGLINTKNGINEPIGAWNNLTSYNINFKNEWNSGFYKNRVDKLVEMIGKNSDGEYRLVKAGTIHSDAFFCRPSDECTLTESQQARAAMYRYWHSLGIDVTNEAYPVSKVGEEKETGWIEDGTEGEIVEPLWGLLPAVWHMYMPASYYMTHPSNVIVTTNIPADWGNDADKNAFLFGWSMMGENIITDTNTFKPGLIADWYTHATNQFGTRTAVFTYLNSFERLEINDDETIVTYSDDVVADYNTKKITKGDAVIVDRYSVFVPMTWKNKEAILAYSYPAYTDKFWKIPDDCAWATEGIEVEIYKNTKDGEEYLETQKITDGGVSLSIEQNSMLVVKPKEISVSGSVSYSDEDATINLSFTSKTKNITADEITKDNIVVTSGNGSVDYALEPVVEQDKVLGAKLTLKNNISTADMLKVNVKFANYEAEYNLQKPITTEDTALKNSSNETVLQIKDITDGKLYIAGNVVNNTYTAGKNVKIISAVYNNGELYGAKITDAAISYGDKYTINSEFAIPIQGLDDNWSAAVYVWAEDMTTPLAVKKTYR